MTEGGPQAYGRLAVREEGTAFLVVREEDPDDWLARFEKGDGFPAREWAENMARVFNRRLEHASGGPPPGTRPPSYHPGAVVPPGKEGARRSSS